MIVLIPSYKRTDILHWVIGSVIDCDTRGIDERILILIVNNCFQNRQIVDSVVSNINFKNFECQVIHREEEMTPIESWFSAIFSIANEDEVVCLLGDDDILLPWGLKNRYYQIRQSRGDMLLSDFYQRLYFFQNGEKVWLDCEMPSPPVVGQLAVPWDYLPAKHPEASFMSNHCYRNTATFRKGFATAMTWCRTQDWVPTELAAGNCPFYMAYALKSVGGKVMALHEKDVLRGSVADEAMYQDYADGGNTAFYGLLIYDTFSNPALHADLEVFNALRCIYKRSFLSGFLSIIDNKKISTGVCLKTMRHSGIGISQLFSRSSLSNIKCIVRMVPWLKGFRLKRRAKSNALKRTQELFQIIESPYYKGCSREL